MKISVTFAFVWYDCWVGWYYDRSYRVLYVCLLPMLVMKIVLRARAGGAS